MTLVGRVRRRVPHHEHERTTRIEPVGAHESVVLPARTSTLEDVRLRPAGDDDPACVDVVVAAQILRHDLVLDDVALAVGRDDALADRVIPARDVSSDGEVESAGGREVRQHALRLHVRNDERGAVGAHRLEKSPWNVPSLAEEPPLHRALDAGRARQPARARRVEHPVRVTGLHARGVEPVTAVHADREWVVAELPVEGRVHAACRPFAEAARAGRELGSLQHSRLPETVDPGTRIGLGDEEDGGGRTIEPLAQPFHDAGVEEDPDREQVGKDDPDAPRRHGMRTRARAAIRSASDAPSRPW